MTRPSWDDYFLAIAQTVATRGTCPRRRVGAVLVKDNRILVAGYNGSLPGRFHCDDVGCKMVNNHCVRTVHAEMNAIAQAAKLGISVDGSTLYCTLQPCDSCLQVLVAAGVKRHSHYLEAYGSSVEVES